MIDTVFFEFPSGEVVNSADYGLLLKSFDAPEPKPKTYRVQVEGADGELDMTEWAGVVRYENRTVSAAFRDMQSEGYKRLVNQLLGRNCKIILSSDPDWYFYGRCDEAESRTRKRVTDTPLVFTCQPYKTSRFSTIIRQQVANDTKILLKAARRVAIPEISLTDECVLTWAGENYTRASGTFTIPQIVITDTARELAVSGSGTITITWTDGVL